MRCCDTFKMRTRQRLSRKERKDFKKLEKKVAKAQTRSVAICRIDKTNNVAETTSETECKITGVCNSTGCEQRLLGSSHKLHQSHLEATYKINEPVDYMQYYKPIPLPTVAADSMATNTLEENSLMGKSKCLGKWFPLATVVKSELLNNGEDLKASLALFYQYAIPQWDRSKSDVLAQYLTTIGKRRGLGGRIRVAQEGVNATVSSLGRAPLRHFVEDLRRFDARVFANVDVKYVDELPSDRHFKNLKVLPVKELVYYGFSEKDAPLNKCGIHLDPEEYHRKLAMHNTVVIDVRNHYEAAIGRFDGQQRPNLSILSGNSYEEKRIGTMDNKHIGAAEYIDPEMRKSTDFPEWLSQAAVQEKLSGKQVLMYCTGGVRCERASAYLANKMGCSVNGVYQLSGGIEKYLQTFPDGGFWRGKNFVFDKRESIGVNNKNGDGGVIRKRDDFKEKADCRSSCCCCGKPWDRYVGKKKCYTCGVPVLMCDKCMSEKPDKTLGKEISVRCPLCVKDEIRVPVRELEYTSNGVIARVVETREHSDANAENGDLKMAKSVLKWGGGHAANKKRTQKLKRKICRLGTKCTRADCFFGHPG